MFKKSLGFGLLAAALMVAPGAAFANTQSQNSNQQTVQNGTAIDGSVNAQSSESLNVQEQTQKIRERVGNRGGRFGHSRRPSRPSYCGGSYNGQSQNSSQGSVQNGVAVNHSDNAQSGSSVSDQRQTASNSRACR
ncbi:MAG: hypothetical protein WBA39_27005 [Rivularia sp. (in: cyanobacteria)]